MRELNDILTCSSQPLQEPSVDYFILLCTKMLALMTLFRYDGWYIFQSLLVVTLVL
jgi:hypothetical protein